MPKIKCDACGEVYKYDSEDAGQSITCECGATVVIPSPETGPPDQIACERCGSNYNPKFFPNGCPLCAICGRCNKLLKGMRRQLLIENVEYCQECYKNLVLPPPPPPPPPKPPEPVIREPEPLSHPIECANCSELVGRLEPEYRYRGLQICGGCNQRFNRPINFPVDVPGYTAMGVVSTFIRVGGLVTMVIGVVAIIVAVVGAIAESETALMFFAVDGIAAIIAGLIQLAVGEALSALRDLAVNSFHIRNRI